MPTYLLTWVQENWSWDDYETDFEEFEKRGRLAARWSCGITKKILPGDRLFLIKLGKEPKGIIASGWALSGSYTDEHWNEEKAVEGRDALYVKINFDTLLRPPDCFPFARLGSGKYSEMLWSPQASGVTIRNDIAETLEEDWADFLKRTKIDRESIFPDEAETQQSFVEGAVRTATVNFYERDPQAREVCINHFGPSCQVCGFDFEETYGKVGRGFIHVHHLRPLAEIGREYVLNPIEDLRPVCPNCHAMLHKRKPAFSIDELVQMIRSIC